jgi:hypothetical protein
MILPADEGYQPGLQKKHQITPVILPSPFGRRADDRGKTPVNITGFF